MLKYGRWEVLTNQRFFSIKLDSLISKMTLLLAKQRHYLKKPFLIRYVRAKKRNDLLCRKINTVFAIWLATRLKCFATVIKCFGTTSKLWFVTFLKYLERFLKYLERITKYDGTHHKKKIHHLTWSSFIRISKDFSFK